MVGIEGRFHRVELVELVQRMGASAMCDIETPPALPLGSSQLSSSTAKHKVVIESLNKWDILSLSGKSKSETESDLSSNPMSSSQSLSDSFPRGSLSSLSDTSSSGASSSWGDQFPLDNLGDSRSVPVPPEVPPSSVNSDTPLPFASSPILHTDDVIECEKKPVVLDIHVPQTMNYPPWHHRLIAVCLLLYLPAVCFIKVQDFISGLAMFCFAICPLLVWRLSCHAQFRCAPSTYGLDLFGLLSILASIVYWQGLRRNLILNILFLLSVPAYFSILVSSFLIHLRQRKRPERL